MDVAPPEKQNYGKYVTKLKDSLKQAYDIASRNITAAQHRQKSNHDVRARAAILEVRNPQIIPSGGGGGGGEGGGY